MTQARKILWTMALATTLLLMPSRAAAQSGTVTDDGFLSTNSATQVLNLNGQGISLLVAGSNATIGSAHLGATKTFVRFQLQSSLPPGVSAANVPKATLKLYVSPGIAPSGTIDLYTVTGDWNESTLNPSSSPGISSSPFITGIALGKTNSFLVVDVTQLVQSWLKGAANGGLENRGIALVASTSTTYVVFDSKESIVTSHEPRLEIVLASDGPTGAAATIQVGSTTTVSPGGQASVTNSGTQNAAVLNFSIPQGPAGANGQSGPAGQAATVQVGTTMTVPAGTPASVMNGGTANAAVLNFLVPQGLSGTQGPKGDPGPIGLPGLPGPPGQNPVGAALTTTSNTFAGNQTINGNLILGSGGGVQFSDGSIQTTASIGGGGGIPAGYMITGTTPVAPSGYTFFGSFSGGNSWVSVAPMPVVRDSLIAGAVNGKIYAIGGRLQLGVDAQSTVQAYDPSSNTWSTTVTVFSPRSGAYIEVPLEPMPTARAGLAGVVVNGKIYALGGRDANGTAVNTLEVYDPSTNSWSTAASMQTARWLLAAATVNGRIYAIGGRDANGAVVDTVEVYNPSTNSWSTAASLRIPRFGLAAAALNGKIYAIGSSNANSPGAVNTVEIYDPSTDSWTTAASMLTARSELAAAAVNGKIYAIGGGTGSTVLNTVEVYDPSTNSWSTASSMLTARDIFGAADVNGLIYVFGGIVPAGAGSTSMTRAAEQYSPPVPIYIFIKN